MVSIYIYIFIFFFLNLGLGEMALQRFPHMRPRILEVQKTPAFEVRDLRWIADCLGFAIRLSMGEDRMIVEVEDADT